VATGVREADLIHPRGKPVGVWEGTKIRGPGGVDNVCKLNESGQKASFYGGGWVDAPRYEWLTHELAQA